MQTDGQESAINESDKDSAYSDQYSVGSSASKEEHEVTGRLGIGLLHVSLTLVFFMIKGEPSDYHAELTARGCLCNILILK